jgi:hypothetical protein
MPAEGGVILPAVPVPVHTLERVPLRVVDLRRDSSVGALRLRQRSIHHARMGGRSWAGRATCQLSGAHLSVERGAFVS